MVIAITSTVHVLRSIILTGVGVQVAIIKASSVPVGIKLQCQAVQGFIKILIQMMVPGMRPTHLELTASKGIAVLVMLLERTWI